MAYVSAAKAGRLLGLSATTILRWINQGRIEAKVYPGSQKDTIRIPESAVQKLLEGRANG